MNNHQLLNPSSFWFRSALLASMPSSSFAVLFSYSTNCLPAHAPPPIAIKCSHGCRIKGTLRKALLYMLIARPMHPPKNAPDTMPASMQRHSQELLLLLSLDCVFLTKEGQESICKRSVETNETLLLAPQFWSSGRSGLDAKAPSKVKTTLHQTCLHRIRLRGPSSRAKEMTCSKDLGPDHSLGVSSGK